MKILSVKFSYFSPLLFCNILSLAFSNFCPKGCSPCFEHLISCETGGLDGIPTELHEETKKITLVNQIFSQTFLTRQNFSKFSKPKFSIEQLSIRKSNIEYIRSQTFCDISGLDYLDLSSNKKLYIENKAFDNLKLKHLKLDLINNLEFGDNAFQGLLVASLSIKNSQLKEIPYSLIEPISRELRSLFLSNNNINSLSPKYDSLFRQLNVLDLNGNPFICSCNLLWLGVTLRWRQHYISSNNDLLSEVLYPKCYKPLYLKDQFLNEISDSEYNCRPPKLERIEVHFKTHQSAILKCAASIESKLAPITISWKYFNSKESIYPKLLPTSKPNEAEIEIIQKQYIDKYSCSVSSSAGNATVKVNFNWPSYSFTKQWPLNSTNEYYYITKPPWKTNDFHENYFFREQYTLLELLGSILGTFIITILIFIFIYKFYFFKAIKIKKEQLKKSGYVTYETGLYSDSQTYDIPQYTSSSDYRTKLYQPVFQILPSNRLYTDCKDQNNV